LVHDWTKFLPSEWSDYVYTFYAEDGSKRYEENRRFYYAWNSHQKMNKHHWQYWLLKMDNGILFPLEMPVQIAKIPTEKQKITLPLLLDQTLKLRQFSNLLTTIVET
jgi:hypothetical protein